MSRIDRLVEDKDTKTVDLEEVLSNLVDMDITQAVTDFNAMSNAYQAMLYSMARLQEMNILNYLR